MKEAEIAISQSRQEAVHVRGVHMPGHAALHHANHLVCLTPKESSLIHVSVCPPACVQEPGHAAVDHVNHVVNESSCESFIFLIHNNARRYASTWTCRCSTSPTSRCSP